ncbi:MAG: hypothetical protein HN348_22625, partial [Proteobacteria bacterium]|nr:hypothetical protein [Pseudomonadota bacterium]
DGRSWSDMAGDVGSDFRELAVMMGADDDRSELFNAAGLAEMTGIMCGSIAAVPGAAVTGALGFGEDLLDLGSSAGSAIADGASSAWSWLTD